MYDRYLDKKEQIKIFISRNHRRLFPGILYSFNSSYDSSFKFNINSLDFSSNNKIILEYIEFENLTNLQINFFISELDKYYERYQEKPWYEFNTLISKVNKFGLEGASDELKDIFSKEKKENYKVIINERKSKACENYKNFRTQVLNKNQKSNKEDNQLTANQIILLLQEIGFFNHPKIEDASKVRQAELISKITGIHHKTIKNNIEKLDKSLSENGKKYQTDIDKINKMLDDLT